MRVITVVSMIILVFMFTGCGKQKYDRMITSDGQVIVGELQNISGGTAMIDSIRIPLPPGNARILFKNGACLYGSVRMDEEGFIITGSFGTIEASSGNVSIIYWGPEVVEQQIIDVHAGAGWLNTHIEVSEGDLINVTAAGTVSVTGTVIGPEGDPKYSCINGLVPSASYGRLVMRTGIEGSMTVLGESWAGEAVTTGELFLGINTETDDGDGFYTVSLSVVSEGDQRAGHVAIYTANR